MTQQTLRLPALEIRQGPERVLYSFAVDGKRLPDITTVSRIHREEGTLGGYQRPEALAHVRAIKQYLESPNALMLNALVVAFDLRVTFEPAGDGDAETGCRSGHLIVPLVGDDEDKPGWLVDGQQRSAALRDADIERFPVPVVGFITGDVREQRSQFILVNNTKPLPTGLINELLPSTEGTLPDVLLRRRYPAVVLEQLNTHPGSPLEGRIRTPTTPEGVIKDTSMLKVLEASMSYGALYQFRHHGVEGGDTEAMLDVLFDFWGAVSGVWADEWWLAPRKCRLTHGAGITALGFLMDAIVDHRAIGGEMPGLDVFTDDLTLIAPACHWTSGTWDFGMRWDEIQVVPAHVAALTEFLLGAYGKAVGRPKVVDRVA
jgi:DGQHR domain-containing protein